MYRGVADWERMTTPSDDGSPAGAAPFLPPARPVAPNVQSPTDRPLEPDADGPDVPTSPAEVPFLPSSRPPEPAPPVVAAPTFDAKAMVESQKHVNANPAYGALPAGTQESRAAARQLRQNANRKRRRGKLLARVVALLVLAGLGVGAYFAYRAIQDDPPPADGSRDSDEPNAGDTARDDGGEGGALTPVGEQEQVIEVLDDLNSGARPSAGGLLDAVDDARDAVGQAEPPVATLTSLTVADVFTPAVLDHTDVLDAVDGHERFVVRTADLVAINPSAHTTLVEQLLSFTQVAADDPRLEIAPVVLPGDIGIAIQRDDDLIVAIVAVATDPTIRSVGP